MIAPPLGSTVDYARWARNGEHGLHEIPVSAVQAGDWLGWSADGNMDHSGGQDGHGMIATGPAVNGTIPIIESSGTGPRFNTRPVSRVTMAARLDGMTMAGVNAMCDLTRQCLARGVTYFAGSGDNDHDGTPDRADLWDNRRPPGVDCTGYNKCCWDAAASLGPTPEEDVFTPAELALVHSINDKLDVITRQMGDGAQPGVLRDLETAAVRTQDIQNMLGAIRDGLTNTLSHTQGDTLPQLKAAARKLGTFIGVG